MIDIQIQKAKAETFRKLHHTGKPLILPNIWEPLGAALLEKTGYPALATSSSAIALTHGFLDGQKISFQEHLLQLHRICKAVTIPVSADIENGYASNDEELTANIEALIDAGVIGINYEDSNKPDNQLISLETQCEKIRIIRETAKRKGVPLFINARVDTYVHGDHLNEEEKLAETLKRGKAYQNAGADGLFPIIITNLDHIKTLVQEISMPINVMLFAKAPKLEILQELGVQRISMGSSYLKIALQAMKKFAEGSRQFHGSEEIRENEITSDLLESLISK